MKELTIKQILEAKRILDEADRDPELLVEEELTYDECMELIAAMDRFEKEAKIRLDGQVKVYTSKECSQEFLRSLLQRR